MGIFHIYVTAWKKQIEPEENSGQKLPDVKDSRKSLTEILWSPTDYVALIGQLEVKRANKFFNI